MTTALRIAALEARIDQLERLVRDLLARPQPMQIVPLPAPAPAASWAPWQPVTWPTNAR